MQGSKKSIWPYHARSFDEFLFEEFFWVGNPPPQIFCGVGFIFVGGESPPTMVPF